MLSFGDSFGSGFNDLAGFGATPAESTLQRALGILALATNDKTLAVKVDGIVGPGTAAAVNRAMVNYVKNAPAALRTGRLTVAQVKQNAVTLSNSIAAEGQRRGQKAPPVTAVKKTVAPAAKPVAKPTAKAVAPKAAAPVVTAVANKAAIAALQNAVRAVGDAAGDRVLRIAADGIPGPATAAAVNRVMVNYAKTAPATFRTGKLTVAQISANAPALTAAITPTIAILKAQKAAAPKAAAKPAAKPAAVTATKTGVAGLQEALQMLGQAVKDAALNIKVDGIVGPNTARAVNRAFTAYINSTEAPAQYRTGKLTTANVIASLGPLTAYLRAELGRQQNAEAAAADAAPSQTRMPGMPAQTAPVPASPTGQDEANAWDEAAAENAPSAAPQSSNAAAAQARMPAPAPIPTPTAEEPEEVAPAASAKPAAITPYIPPAAPSSSGGGGGGGGSPAVADDATAPDTAAEPAAAPGPTPTKSFPWKWVAIGTGGVVTLGVLGWLLFAKGESAPADSHKHEGPTPPRNTKPKLFTRKPRNTKAKHK